jgi:hypothetical protein
VFEWLGDTFRLIGASLYWNTRKSRFVRRGRLGSCPCFNPSDDPVPGRVRCRAVLLWNEPSRFRAVCPLLTRTEHGWCCSVGAGEVRPFWGRAALGWSGALLTTYLAVALLGFGFLRFGVGVPVSLHHVFWPGAWREVRGLQADVLFERAMQAFARGEARAAVIALESARRIDSQHYAATRLLAQITMFEGSVAYSDQVFAELFAAHPERRSETAVIYHDTLASVGRMDALAELCLRLAQEPDGPTAKWVRSLLFAVRRLPDAGGWLDSHAVRLRLLPPHPQLLLEAERSVAVGDIAAAVRRLRAPFSGALNPIYMQEQVERLAAIGAVGDAQVLLGFYGPLLGTFEQGLTQFVVEMIRGDLWVARGEFARLLELPLTTAQFTRLAERLIVHPDPARWREVLARAARLGPEERRELAPTFWVTSLVHNMPTEARAWRDLARNPAGTAAWPDVASIDFTLHDPRDRRSPFALIQAVELPREVVFALLARLSTQVPREGRKTFLP